MRDERIGSIVVVDAADRPIELFTVRDLIGRVVLPGLALDTPMRAVMTPDPVRCLPRRAPSRRSWPWPGTASARSCSSTATNSSGWCRRKTSSPQRVGVTQLSASIRAATDLVSLKHCAADIFQLGHNMMAQGVAPEQLTQILTTLNDLLTQRVIELECNAAEVCRHSFCWLAFGSEGRMEQTLSTDQDNGNVFSLRPGETVDAVCADLLPVAERINQALDACGFPLCKGQIMAMNPKWCLSLDEWKTKFADWIDAGDPEALLNASILFDFRPLRGNRADRHAAAVAARQNRRHPSHPAPDGRQRPAQPAAPGPGGDFVVASEGEQAHTLDLKLNGRPPSSMPPASSPRPPVSRPPARPSACAPQGRGSTSPAEIEAWISAFYFIQLLRLRNQHAKHVAGLPMDNLINPDHLNDLDRHILKEAPSARRARSRRGSPSTTGSGRRAGRFYPL